MENIITDPASRPSKGGYCAACKTPLPPDDLFCPRCGPPVVPDDDPEAEGLSLGQTVLRIALISLLFAVAVVYKFDVDLRSYLPDFFSPPPPKVEKPAEDVKIVYLVSAPRANVRESGSKESKILFVLGKSESVVVLQKDDKWWKIQAGDRVGWMLGSSLIAKAE